MPDAVAQFSQATLSFGDPRGLEFRGGNTPIGTVEARQQHFGQASAVMCGQLKKLRFEIICAANH